MLHTCARELMGNYSEKSKINKLKKELKQRTDERK